MTGDVIPEVSIISSGHDVADARLHRLVAALVRQGAPVEVLGLGEAPGGPEGAVVRSWPRRGLLGRALHAVRLGALARGRVLLALDPDALLLAAPLARLRHRVLCADVHEDYASLLRDRRWARGLAGLLAAALVGLATRAAARAPLTLVADDHVPPLDARDRLVVRNEPDLDMLPPLTEPDRRPRAVYVGDVRASRGLFAMLDALAGAPGWTLDVVGPVSGADRDALDARLRDEPGLAARVRWHGRLAPRAAWQVAAGAWVGLCLLEDTPAFRDTIPSKVYEYLAAGMVPVVTDLPRQAETVRASGGGVVVADGSADRALRDLEADPAALAALRAQGLAWSGERRAGATAYDEAARKLLGLARA